MDELAVREHVEWNGKRCQGLIDYGTNIESDTLPEAKEELVFLLLGLNSQWNTPMAY